MRLAGVDEAGRGPLAGPVVAVALVFEREFLEAEAEGLLSEVNDSKQVSAPRRESIYKFLVGSPYVQIGIGFAEPAEIDSINIGKATYAVMSRALTVARVLEKWCESVKHHALQMRLGGQEIPGHELR
ncbi:MAG: hypothetical protein WCP86_05395, partial [bacterium]